MNQHYWPDVASTGQHLTDLAEHLAASGLEVSVLCGRAGYRGGTLAAPARESRHGVRVRRVSLPGFRRLSGSQAGRAAEYAAFHLRALVTALRDDPPDLVISLTTPSLLPVTIRLACALRGVPYGIWAMDLHPEVESELDLLPGGRATAAPLHAASRWSYRGADFVVALGPHMARRIRTGKGVLAERIHEIPVWTDAADVRPVARAENPLRGELGYGEDDFVVMYSGNAGLAHRFDPVLEAADRLREKEDVHFLFVGGGPRREEIEREARVRRLSRFRYLDYFPREALARSLSVGDVHLLTLRTRMAGLAAPGKLYGVMAAGRPVLMVGPEASEPGEVIREGGIGHVVDPSKEDRGAAELVEWIERLRADEGLRRDMGRRARRILLERFDREGCCRTWQELIEAQLSSLGSTT